MPAVKSYVASHRDLVRMNVDGLVTLNVRVKKPNEVYLDLVTASSWVVVVGHDLPRS